MIGESTPSESGMDRAMEKRKCPSCKNEYGLYSPNYCGNCGEERIEKTQTIHGLEFDSNLKASPVTREIISLIVNETGCLTFSVNQSPAQQRCVKELVAMSGIHFDAICDGEKINIITYDIPLIDLDSICDKYSKIEKMKS